LADHGALKLGEGARNLKHQPPGRRGRVDGLLLEIHAEKVDERASTPVDCRAMITSKQRLWPSYSIRSSPGRASRTGPIGSAQ